MKIKKVEGATIIDVLTNYADLNKIYDFLKEKSLDYIKKDQLTESVYEINDNWRTVNSQHLIDNGVVLTSRDDEYYFPPTADDIKFSNHKISNLFITKSGTTYYFTANVENFGYLKDGATWHYRVTNLDTDTLIASGSTIQEPIGYRETTSLSPISATLETTDIFKISYYQLFYTYEMSQFSTILNLR